MYCLYSTFFMLTGWDAEGNEKEEHRGKMLIGTAISVK